MTYYEILGVSKNATEKEIKTAYKTLIKKYHPDIYKGNKEYAEKRTADLNVAYEILSNIESRSQYDSELLEEQEQSNYSYTAPNYSYTPPTYNSPKYNTDYYKEQYYKKYGNYNEYNKRYANYNSTNTQKTSTSTNNVNDKNTSQIQLNLKTFFIVLAIYLLLVIISFSQFKAILNQDEPPKLIPSSSSSSSTTNTPSTSTSSTQNINDKENPYIAEEDKSKYDITEEDKSEYNITDLISEEELIELYTTYYKDDFSDYTEFKESLQKYYEEMMS